MLWNVIPKNINFSRRSIHPQVDFPGFYEKRVYDGTFFEKKYLHPLHPMTGS